MEIPSISRANGKYHLGFNFSLEDLFLEEEQKVLLEERAKAICASQGVGVQGFPRLL